MGGYGIPIGFYGGEAISIVTQSGRLCVVAMSVVNKGCVDDANKLCAVVFVKRCRPAGFQNVCRVWF